MTYARREELLSKDILTIKEFGELTGLCYPTAQKLMLDIKRKHDRFAERLGHTIDGKMHIQDYFDVLNLDGDRYAKPMVPVTEEERAGNASSKA